MDTNTEKKGDGFLSMNETTKLRGIVMKETGITYDLRACRRTFGQHSLDEDIPLDAVSKMLGHKTTKTTETYYARKRNDKAIAEAQKVWAANASGIKPIQTSQEQPGPITPLIENKFEISGYR